VHKYIVLPTSSFRHAKPKNESPDLLIAFEGTLLRKINAGHIGLVDRPGIPPPLEDAYARGLALTAETGDRYRERRLVGGDSGGRRVRNRDAVQRSCDDGVSFSVHNADVRHAGVRSLNCDFYGDNLIRSEMLHVRGIVRKQQAFAEVELAGGRLVRAGDRFLALLVTIIIG